MNDVKKHYDALVDKENDPFRDPPELLTYMNGWDGDPFLDALQLEEHLDVLEIGVGTGRLTALRPFAGS